MVGDNAPPLDGWCYPRPPAVKPEPYMPPTIELGEN